MSDNLPPSDGPEYLDQTSGAPLGQEPRSSRKKPLLIGVAAVVGVALVGGGVFAATQLAGGGEQPSEALPADTLGYVSIDMDPSASQKIEAIQMFRKFPALKDSIDIEDDGDIRKRLFEEIQASDGCEGIDYEEDIEPWLGERLAIAGIEVDGEPTGVGVVAINDADAAEEGVEKLRTECGGESEDDGAFVTTDGWMVVAETEDIAQTVIDRTEEGTLADDEDFVRWTDEVGDPGIITMYAAPEAGQLLAEAAAEAPLDELAGGSDSSSLYSDEELEQLEQDLIASGMSEEEAQEYVDTLTGGSSDTPDVDAEALQEEMTAALEDFKGMGATLRFDDGAVEFELASENTASEDGLTMGDQGAEIVGSLPEDTVAAFGLSLPEGWAQAAMDQFEMYSDGEVDLDELIAEAEAETGLSLPEDLETLTGEAMAVSLGSDFDPEALANSSDLSQVPMGLKVKGDADAINEVMDKILTAAQVSADGPVKSESDGDVVAFSPSEDYVGALVEDGGLADNEVYADVLDGNDNAGMVMFVNFNAAEGWISEMAGSDPSVEENLEPLGGVGMTAWTDDSVGHVSIRLTTD